MPMLLTATAVAELAALQRLESDLAQLLGRVDDMMVSERSNADSPDMLHIADG